MNTNKKSIAISEACFSTSVTVPNTCLPGTEDASAIASHPHITALRPPPPHHRRHSPTPQCNFPVVLLPPDPAVAPDCAVFGGLSGARRDGGIKPQSEEAGVRESGSAAAGDVRSHVDG